MKDLCHGCGACCTYKDIDNKWKSCRYLGINNKCTVYETRIGRHVGNGFYCGYISKSDYDYPGCSLNKGRDIHPAYENLMEVL